MKLERRKYYINDRKRFYLFDLPVSEQLYKFVVKMREVQLDFRSGETQSSVDKF